MEHRDLKSLYAGIEADEFATAQSRKRLAIELESTGRVPPESVSNTAPDVRKSWLPFPLFMRAGFACLVVAALALTGWRQYQQSSFEAVELSSLQAFVERNGWIIVRRPRLEFLQYRPFGLRGPLHPLVQPLVLEVPHCILSRSEICPRS